MSTHGEPTSRGTWPESDPDVEELLRDRPRRARPMTGRERVMSAAFGLTLVGATVAMWLLIPGQRHWDPALALLLLGTYAAAESIEFDNGTGFAVPTEIVLVPMVLLLPAPAVPLLVAGGILLARLPSIVRGARHRDRALLAPCDAWFAVGPALVVALLAPGEPALALWPVYLLALLAQLVVDGCVGTLYDQVTLGVRPTLQLKLLLWPFAVDAALAPIGLLAALVAAQTPAAVLLVTPLTALLAVFALERRTRIDQALELSAAYRGAVLLMGEVLEVDDAYTGGEHTNGVVELALLVGVDLGLSAAELRELEFGALLHDIGKIRIADEIINKPGKLSPREWDVIRRHPQDGQRMLEKIGGLLADVGVIVRHHHERWDGTGYPDGLSGALIPLASRIITVCDSFSAMTTDRSYRQGMSPAAAFEELAACSGTQFDARVVASLRRVVPPVSAARPTQAAA